ncbi:1299_t:CDS:2 [Funneliformis geosporum]|uniref:1299_t:CDS:1 n=1 Tax=Funneliformis geosporum TaxID=1117311 RepID=A0A9W4SA22_9GLOM|nr:1299_t:CDS:2 [Funneliformis geosporum]
MLTISLNLSKKVEKELEKDLRHLEAITKKPREFHIKKALIQYLEEIEDIQDVQEHIKNQGKAKYYTSEQLKKNLIWNNVYLNIPFNEPEYKNLTNLLEFSQVEKEKKNLAEISNILFSDFSNNFYDLKIEITRLKISELVIQIPTKKTELEKKITNTKNKLGKAEKYLFEKLLAEKPNSEKLSELKEVLSEYQSEIENILTNQQEINNLENHLEYLQELQTNQLEAKIEINYN